MHAIWSLGSTTRATLATRAARATRATRAARATRATRAARATLAVSLVLAVAGCGASVRDSAGHGRILAVGAENEYADVISQIGGRYVTAVAVESNPNTDPHTFEASPSVARAVANARLVVQNGVGYDAYMNKIESADSVAGRKIITVGRLLGLGAATANPHLWYRPGTMSAVARALATDLGHLLPARRAYFRRNATRFIASLRPWYRALAQLARTHPGTAVAVTEPVADDMLQAAGFRIATPFSFQADIMNGVDPAPQAVSLESSLLSRRRVAAFVYNQQVTDTLTQSFLAIARRHRIPVVGVYETMPSGFHYQSWMLAEARALDRALTSGVSTSRL